MSLLVAQVAAPSPGQPPAGAPGEAPPTVPGPSASGDRDERPPLPRPGEMARCKALIDAGLYGAARQRLEPVVAAHPGWARASLLLGLTYYKEHRFELANDSFARALEADPLEIAVKPFYGWSLYAVGELAAARGVLESLVAEMPGYAAGHYALGVVLFDLDEIEAARRRFETAAELASAQGDDPMAGRAHGRLGDVAMRRGDLEAARRHLERAVELFPDEPESLWALSRVLQRLGDDEGAAAARRRFEDARAAKGAAGEPFPE